MDSILISKKQFWYQTKKGKEAIEHILYAFFIILQKQLDYYFLDIE